MAKPTNPKLLKLYESAKRMHLVRIDKERLEELLANWPTAEEVTADPERLNNLTGQVESIERRINQRKAESQDDPVIE